MTRILLGNLPEDTSEERIRAALAAYARIGGVLILRQGSAPSALIEVVMSREEADRLVRRLDGLWHAGRFLQASVLLHQ